MKAVVFHGVGDIRLEDVAEPKIEHPNDAIVKITSSAICGTDLHMIRGTVAGMVPGTILGHEAVGVVAETGKGVRNFGQGDRVVVCSTIGCGYCAYCRSGYYAQCDYANPHGKLGGTAFYGGPEATGPFNGMQAEYVRVPYANVNLVSLPPEVGDEDAILISDIFPTGYFGADIAEITPGDTVAVFGCGPVGLFAIVSAKLLDASRIIAVDAERSRLEMARQQGAEVVDFNAEDPVETIRELTGGIGVDRAIDAVGVDAAPPSQGPSAETARAQARQFQRELDDVAPETNVQEGRWQPGGAPSQALEWCVQALAKAGTLSIIGVYSPHLKSFPIGTAMQRHLTMHMGNCNHRAYVPMLVNLARNGTVRPTEVLTQREPMMRVLEAYEAFDQRKPGWVKVELVPGG